ncbi:hypothetical protein QJS10_CPA05g02205 [Acorus calamus]|uniref:PLD phosphodiesterase domain-containing protein n=1 Tax=Acorus calamus TaxID=4465 RepID=A0AAV9EV95_ACOCL|nr:hypothetical protein QJS10_CPA05g02205 [Acorus calamus]
MPHLPLVPGVLSSGDVLKWLAGNSTKSLDIIAQYWQLLAQPGNPESGDFGYSDSDMERFGAAEGAEVYRSLEDAADRKVDVRIVQHSGVYPDFDQESSSLASGRPNVQNVTLLFGKWWGSGIVHAKVWISDSKDVYIGSANNDWKSLTQVKELGIYLVDCPSIAEKVEVYYNNLWTLSTLNASVYTTSVWDDQWQALRKLPCWSHFVPLKERCKWADEQGWVDTIKSVQYGGTIRISSMDWLGQSQYLKQTVYWASLSSAISEVIFSKNATAKILVAHWAHFIPNTDQYLKALLYSNILCNSSKYNKCGGKVEIRYYEVPGFNDTGAAVKDGKSTGNVYPGYTRVNHGKYAVSDVRAHIGTSNLIWDYFYTTAGVSFGTYHPSLIAQLQEVFDADWNSPYAIPVEPLQGS